MIDGIPIADLAPPTLVGIFFLLVVFGRLVPWGLYKAKVEECDKWRAAYEAERDARLAAVDQTKQLVDATEDIHEIVASVFRGAQLTRQTGEGYVVLPASQKK